MMMQQIESQSISINGNPNQRQNFLFPDNHADQVLLKREEFAVALRKKKRVNVLQAKRRKIARSMADSKSINGGFPVNTQWTHGQNGNGSFLDAPSVENAHTYSGYPRWRECHYTEHLAILKQISQKFGQSFEMYSAQPEMVDRMQFLIEVLGSSSPAGTQISPLEQLAIFTRLRQEVSSEHATPDISSILSTTDLLKMVFMGLRQPSFSEQATQEENDILKCIKLEAVWILTNLAYGASDDIKVLLDFQSQNGMFQEDLLGFVKEILDQKQPDFTLVDQTLYLVGNISGTSKALATYVRRNLDLISIMDRLLPAYRDLPKQLAQNVIWVAKNFSEDERKLSLPEIRGLSDIFFEFLERFGTEIEDEDTLIEILKGFQNLSKIPNQQAINIVSGIDHPSKPGHLISLMCDLLGRKNEDIYGVALKYLGSILTSEDSRIAAKALSSEILEKINNITYSCNVPTQKESLWVLSNIAADSPSDVIKSSVITRVLSLAASLNIDVQHEALWVLCNCIDCCSYSDLEALVFIENNACVPLLLKGLKSRDSKLVQSLLESLKRMLEPNDAEGDSNGRLATTVYHVMVEHNGLDYLEALQRHPQNKIFECAEAVHDLYRQYEDALGDNEYIIDTKDGAHLHGLGGGSSTNTSEGASVGQNQWAMFQI